jgi:hypothetical protein
MIRVLLTVAGVAAMIFCLNLYVDPFQIYHKSFLSGKGLNENQRYQNAGLINQYLADPAQDYDSIMVGTSMSQNFTGEMANKTLGWHKTMRLFMPGAVGKEQMAVLRHALDTQKAKHVLLELHPFLYQDAYQQQKQVELDLNLYFPAYLYNGEVRDDLPYLFNKEVLKASLRAIRNNSTGNLTPETIGYWANEANVASDHAAFNTPENIERIKSATAGFALKAWSEDERKALHYPVISDILLPVLDHYCNSGTEIILFIPPWPRYRYQKSAKVTSRSLYMLQPMLESISKCPNISLYDFDLLDLAGDLDNYSDEQHYLPKVNQELLEHIANHEDQLTLENIQSFESRFIDTLNHYQVMSSMESAPVASGGAHEQ